MSDQVSVSLYICVIVCATVYVTLELMRLTLRHCICASNLLAYRLALRAFWLALRGYLVASLPRALCLRSHAFHNLRSHLARFAREMLAHVSCFAPRSLTFRAHENLRKKSVFQSTRSALKRIEMQKKKFFLLL